MPLDVGDVHLGFARPPDGRGHRACFHRSHTFRHLRWHPIVVASVSRRAGNDLLSKAATMAHDYEDLHDLDQLDDRELRDLVKEQLGQHSGLDVAEITVHASHGVVRLAGRVGTDQERRIAEHVLTDVLGVQKFTNDLLVDPGFRATNPEATDENQTSNESDGGKSSIDVEVPLTGESAHLADGVVEGPDGAPDMQTVMEDGTTWNPPDSPTPEGLRGTDAGPEEMDGRH